MPLPYLANPTAPPQSAAPGPDATAEFQQKLNDPSRWVIKAGVPVFKAHERTDPATGQLIKVDLPKLYRIAANMQTLERQGGVPIRMTLGHTEPGKPEVQQPPVGGYYRNARVQPFGPKGEPAVVVDEWLDPQYQGVRKNFPYRSAEYYDDAEQITGVALLTRDPYLDLGVVAYGGTARPTFYTDELPTRPLASWNGRRPVMYRLVIGDPVEYPYTPGPGVPPQYAVPPTPLYDAPPAGQQPPPGGYPAYAPPAPYGAPAPTPYGAPTNYNPALLAGLLRGGAMAAGSQMMGGMGGGGRDDNARYSAPWPPMGGRMQYSPPPMHRQHPSGGAVYGRTPYADDPFGGGPPPGGPMAGPGGPPPGAGGPGGGPAEKLQMVAMALIEIAQELGGGGAGPGGPPGPVAPPGAPTEPFPPEEGEGEGRDGQYARYGAPGAYRPAGRSGGYGRRPGRYGSEGSPVNYGYPPRPGAYPAPAPTPYGAPPPAYPPGTRTLSGRPVGAALRESQLNYQLAQQNQAIQMLMYERDQSDTEACVTAIQRLADAGFPVTEYEVRELKAKPRDQRQGYLDHIATHYQRVGTEHLPPLLGDPTPAPAANPADVRISREDMELALKTAQANPADPTAYNRALEAIRYQRATGGAPPANRLAQYGPQYGEPPAAGGFSPANPYGEPSPNGQAY